MAWLIDKIFISRASLYGGVQGQMALVAQILEPKTEFGTRNSKVVQTCGYMITPVEKQPSIVYRSAEWMRC